MPELIFKGRVYRLRAGSPMPIRGGGNFVLHTFMAEVNDVDVIACTEKLPASSQFRGQGGALMSASYNRLGVKGGNIFSGKITYPPEYIDEDTIQ